MDIDLKVPASAAVRAKALVDQFFTIPEGTDVSIAAGEANGKPAILVTMADRHHGLFVKEAKALALGLEGAMNKYPDTAEARAVPNLILALRAGADAATQIAEEKKHEDHRGDEADQGQQREDH